MSDDSKNTETKITASDSSQGSGEPLYRRKKYILAAVSLFLALALVLSAAYFYMNSTKTIVAGSICNETIVAQANQALDTGNVTKLTVVANHIMSLKNYNKDADCLYIVTRYYIATKDINNSKKSFNELKQLVDQANSNTASNSSQSSATTSSSTVDGFSKNLESGNANMKTLQELLNTRTSSDSNNIVSHMDPDI